MKSAARWLPALLWLAFLSACSEGTSVSTNNTPVPPQGLPADPQQWVCPDSLAGATPAAVAEWCITHPNRGKPLPDALRNPPPMTQLADKNRYEIALEKFVKAESYKTELGWLADATWRFTGPYVGEIGSGSNYGTHLPVRIYYSPEVIDWLCNGRQGELPEGAMIIKEMHVIDTALDVTLDPEGCMVINADVAPQAWAMMIKNNENAYDRWFWPIMQRDQFPLYPEERVDPPIVDRSAFPDESYLPELVAPSGPDPTWYPTGYFSANPDKIPNVLSPQCQYGAFCFSCHSSAVNEQTFASLNNPLGKSIRYKQFAATGPVDPGAGLDTHVLAFNQPRDPLATPLASHGAGTRAASAGFDTPFALPLATASGSFLSFYDQLGEVSFATAWQSRLPAQTYDHVTSAPNGPTSFLTSDECAPCHDALEYLADTSNMTVQQEKNGSVQTINLSPYGEWNVSPMGVAGRDPIFFAQLESETHLLPDMTACIEDTCLHCHGVMGQRQLAADTPSQGNSACQALFGVAPPPQVPFGRPFRLDMVTQWPESVPNTEQQYGALARDGISCNVCHRIAAQDLGDESTFTGNFVTGPLDEEYGPYDEVTTKPMHNALGITPHLGTQVTNPDMCGSCHNVLLPIFTNDGVQSGFSYEQATHLEWLNSDYAPNRSRSQSCQDCHMPNRYADTPLKFKIANFESAGFPPTTNRVSDTEITAPERSPYARHSLHGLNLFLNELFQQFPLLLGFRQAERFSRTSLDYPNLLLGEGSIVDMAQHQTATAEIVSLDTTPDGKLRVGVRITNRSGHKLPSGVGFRRIFIELLVGDAAGNILWASGRTNTLGALVAGTSDVVLPTEQPQQFPAAGFQPHYQLITQEDQVQIYEEGVEDSRGQVTTSFLHRSAIVKDNRIRPQGYDPRFYETFGSPYIQALAVTPGSAQDDPDYVDPQRTGADELQYLVSLDAATLARVDDVRATLYSQSMPPAYLSQRFGNAESAAQQTETERLYYMTSHFNTAAATDDSGRQVLANWKLVLTSASRSLH